MKPRSTVPVKLFDERSNQCSPTSSDNNFGIGPCSLFLLRSRYAKLEDTLGFSRKFPVKLFSDKSKYSKEGWENKYAGISPLIELFVRTNLVRLCRGREPCEGKEPVKLLLDKSTTLIFAHI
jgi:hypothetical protein